jgi:hypothetical protein
VRRPPPVKERQEVMDENEEVFEMRGKLPGQMAGFFRISHELIPGMQAAPVQGCYVIRGPDGESGFVTFFRRGPSCEAIAQMMLSDLGDGIAHNRDRVLEIRTRKGALKLTFDSSFDEEMRFVDWWKKQGLPHADNTLAGDRR